MSAGTSFFFPHQSRHATSRAIVQVVLTLTGLPDVLLLARHGLYGLKTHTFIGYHWKSIHFPVILWVFLIYVFYIKIIKFLNFELYVCKT